jgi:hypothetical protein
MPELQVVHSLELLERALAVLQVSQREKCVGCDVGDQRRHLVRATSPLAITLAERLARDVANRCDDRVGLRRPGGDWRHGAGQRSATDQQDGEEGKHHSTAGTQGHSELLGGEGLAGVNHSSEGDSNPSNG